MKKNFFKKLSFVLALAMIVTALAPAAGAFAAKAPKLNASTKYLYLDVEGKNVYDFNISNKVTGWKYLWSSANEDVAEVNEKNGVTTATGAGKTTVSVVISDKDGEEVDELTATVIVRDNIKELTITNTPADGTVKVGVAQDFNRSYVTVANKTKGTSGITRWSVTPSTGATISDAGVFTATVAGEYTITARAFQSKAKYTSWLADATKYASYVTSNEATYKVTVLNAIKEVKAVKTNTLKVTFESAVAAVDKANFLLTNVASTAKVWIKSVTLSADKTFATVELYDNLVSGQSYKLAATVDKQALTGEIAYVKGTPTKIEANTTQVAPAGQSYAIKYTVLDENGLDITADTTVYYSTSVGNTGTVTLSNGALIYATVYWLNPTTGAKVESEKIAITGSTAVGTELVSYVVTTDLTASPNFDGTIAAKLEATGLKVRVKVKDQYGNESTVAYNDSNLTFESLDPSVVVVDATNGSVTPIAVGTGSFRIKYGTTINVIKTITVSAKSVLSGLKVNSNAVSISATASNLDNVADLNDGTLKVNFQDQYSKDYTAAVNTYTVEVLGASDNAIRVNGTYLAANMAPMTLTNGTSYVIEANPAIDGVKTATLKITKDGFTQNVVITAYKSDLVATGYALGGVKNLDINHEYDNDATTGDYTTALKLYSTNAGGFKVAPITGATLVVTRPDGTQKSFNITTTTGAGSEYVVTTSDSLTLDFKKGSYAVLAKATNGGAVYTTSTFTVSDTGVAPGVVLKSNKINDYWITTTNVQALLDNLDGYTVYGFKYVSSSESSVASQSAITTSAVGVAADATLYNFVVDVTKYNRHFEINLGTLVADRP